MFDRDLKTSLKTAYSIEPSEAEKLFIKKHEMRKLNLSEVISLEFKYLGMKNIIAGIVLCAIFFIIARCRSTQFMWVFSSGLTLFGLLPVSMIGISERYGMAELESGCRFSYEFLKSVRELMFGAIGLVLVIVAGVMMSLSIGINALQTICFIAIPFLMNVSACIFITRKWHAKESLYGCTAITLVICLLPIIVQNTNVLQKTEPMYLITLLVVLLLVTVKQSVLYVKESENVVWNLC